MKRMKKTAAFLITVLLIAGCSNSASGSQGSGSPEPEEPGTRIFVDSAGREVEVHPVLCAEAFRILRAGDPKKHT